MVEQIVYICNKCGSRKAYHERGKCEECGGELVSLLKWAEKFMEVK